MPGRFVAKTAFFLLSLLSVPALAAEIEGIQFPAEIQVQDHGNPKTLHLNGLGLRQKTFLNINVFAAGLYLEKPEHDATAILNSPQIKRVVLVFMRNASAEQVIANWNDQFEKNCLDFCSRLKEPHDAFNRIITSQGDVKKGQEVRMTFYADRMEVASRGQATEVAGREFSAVALATFIGPRPPTEELKQGLLAGAQP